MKKEIKAWFSEAVTKSAFSNYPFAGFDCKCIHIGNNFIFRIVDPSGNKILRITHELQKSYQYLLGEIDWQDYLSENGINVPQIVPTIDSKRIAKIDTPYGQFLAICYHESPGSGTVPSFWSKTFIYNWGELAGTINSLSKRYTPKNGTHRHTDWHFDFLSAEKYLPAEEALLLDKWKKLRIKIQSMVLTPAFNPHLDPTVFS